MADLKGSKTESDLLEAFAGESQANRKYLAFAEKADQEGYTAVAKLFRAAAAAETVHAHAHLRALGGIRTTIDNLREALGGETHEFTAMYPQMIEEAAAEGFDTAHRSFRLAEVVAHPFIAQPGGRKHRLRDRQTRYAVRKSKNGRVADRFVCVGGNIGA